MLNIETINQLLIALDDKQSLSLEGCHLYALADHGGMPGLTKQLIRAKAEWLSLFEGSTEENALSAAPLLIKMKVESGKIKHRILVDWLAEHATYSSSLLFFASPLSMPELAHRLAARLDAVLPEEMEILLRFFDPRIFEELMSALTAEQKQNFLSLAHCWWFVDRRGQLQKVEATFADNEPFQAPLILTVVQESALLDASEPDQVAQLLRATVPEEYALLAASMRHDFILRHMKAAIQLKIKATHELALYCGLALLYGEDFAEQKNWQSLLQEVQIGKLSLTQAAAKVPDV